jgi:hypothetical protein
LPFRLRIWRLAFWEKKDQRQTDPVNRSKKNNRKIGNNKP